MRNDYDDNLDYQRQRESLIREGQARIERSFYGNRITNLSETDRNRMRMETLRNASMCGIEVSSVQLDMIGTRRLSDEELDKILFKDEDIRWNQ
jgi:hypothetical protein